MASYQLTEDAEGDVDGFYEYSILHFGLQQARDYVSGLHGCFGNLADRPRLGRDFSHVKAQRPPLRISEPLRLLHHHL